MSSRLRIAIIGGGIGGLTLALALTRTAERKFVRVDIYEAAPELSEIGAGISVSPRTWKMMQKLGIAPSLTSYLSQEARDEPSPVFRFRKSDQSNGVDIQTLTIEGGMLTLHRADLQKVLMEHIKNVVHIHLSKRLVIYKESDHEIQLHFEDGSTAICDLLVGADGLKSVVRKALFENLQKTTETQNISVDPIWSGTFAYRGLVSSAKLSKEMPGHPAMKVPMMYCGKNKHLVVYPVSQGQLVNIVAFFSQPDKEGTKHDGPTAVDVSKDEVLSTFSGWEREVTVLLELIEKPSKWAIQALKPLHIYARNRVALLGDAAHAMTPHQGAGAGQAMEDAYVLGSLLLSAAQNHIPVSRVTEVYNTVRLPFGNFVLNSSRNQGMLYEMTAPGFEHIRELDSSVPFSKLTEIVTRIIEMWKWTWESSIEVDRGRALAML